jgi:predicted RNA-binding Zn ribbon-like protein
MGDEQLAAPGPLEDVRRFVNTRDLETGTDTLGAWLRERGVPASERDGAAALREALRAVLVAHATGLPEPVSALAEIEAAGRRLPLRVSGTLELEPAAGSPLARLLAIAALARADGTWARLKACPGEGCQWALYDRTRSRTRTWCAAAKCGARTRSRAYRRRLSGDG